MQAAGKPQETQKWVDAPRVLIPICKLCELQKTQAQPNTGPGNPAAKDFPTGAFKVDSETILLNGTDSSSEALKKKQQLKDLVYPASGTPRLMQILLRMQQPRSGKGKRKSGKVKNVKAKMYVIAISRKMLPNIAKKMEMAA